MTPRPALALLVAAFVAALTFGGACSKLMGCANVAGDRCGTTFGCTPLSAVPLRNADDPATTCMRYDETQFVTCGAQADCSARNPSIAKDPSGKEWLLSSSCLPAGWIKTTASPNVASCPVCEGMTVAACGGVDYCETFDGRPVDRARMCLLAPQTVGCHTKTPGCAPYSVLANDPTGDEWYFATSCFPAGWQRLNVRNPTFPECAAADGGDGGAGDADSPADGPFACEAVPPSTCATRPDCFVFRANPIDPIRSCYGPAEAVACEAQPDGGAARTCGDAITIASDLHGFRWMFPNTCIPAGWTHPTMPPNTGPACPATTDAGGSDASR